MAIIKFFEKFICTNMTNAVYYEIESLNEKGKKLDRKEAMKLIREKGLTLAYETKDGAIWDTPDKAFFQKYRGESKKVKEIRLP